MLDGLIAALGIACVAYTAAVIARATVGTRATAGFGAVDTETGRPIDVVLDRRRHDRRDSESAEPGCSLHV